MGNFSQCFSSSRIKLAFKNKQLISRELVKLFVLFYRDREKATANPTDNKYKVLASRRELAKFLKAENVRMCKI